MADKPYDVAISFLVQDTGLAQALRDELSKGFRVFFFPHTQEDLSGTNGAESMREPFLTSRLNVVIYRDRWGKTPWTGVESAAIVDSCIKRQFLNLFFFMVEPAEVLPKWLPDTHMRFNYGEFTLDQAVGAIKLRVQEQGGHYEPMTPLKKARLLREEELYQADRALMRSYQGMQRVTESVDALLTAIKAQCDAVAADGNVGLECELNLQDKLCIMRCGNRGMIVRWQQPFSNTLDNSKLSVEKYVGCLLFRPEYGNRVALRQPKLIDSTEYASELSRERECGWKNSKEFLPSVALAEKSVLKFMEFMEQKDDSPAL